VSWERFCRFCGAPTWSPKSPYCREHRPSLEERERWATKTREARGYGAAHRTVRARYEALVASGLARCARCGGPIAAGAPFDLDHSDDRGGYLGVSHPHCNRTAGARRGAAVTNGKADPGWSGPGSHVGMRWSRDWDAVSGA
jgi:hypothetical protein